MKGRGLVISAPSSGAGKTTVTLGLLRALRDVTNVQPAKTGPDYIDPAFHEAACGVPSINLDAWAMSEVDLRANAATRDLLIVEGAMGLFDGAPPDGHGSTADVARQLSLPVILVVDARAMSHSVGALIRGFRDHDASVHIAGVILNCVGSARHEAMLRKALAPLSVPVLGALPREAEISLPSRHLGLVQAMEHPDLNLILDKVSNLIREHVDLEALQNLAVSFEAHRPLLTRPPKRIAIAQDKAFSFAYSHDFRQWRENGTVLTFSPLADEAVPEADEVFLPGGYPELYGAELAQAKRFMQSLREASQTIDIYGECGGYMSLGEAIIDANGASHKMAGLLPLETSFEDRRLHLGYRRLKSNVSGLTFGGHEFHYATTLRAEGQPLYEAWDAEGNALPPMGLIEGRVSGSFAHLISRSHV